MESKYLVFGDFVKDVPTMIGQELGGGQEFSNSGFIFTPKTVKRIRNIIMRNISAYLEGFELERSFKIGVFRNGGWRTIERE